MESLQLSTGQVIDLTKYNALSIEAERVAAAIEITDDFEEQMAVDTLSKIKGYNTTTEDARKNDVSPFNLLVKRINDGYRPFATSFSNAETIIKEKIKVYRMQKEKVRQEEERRRQAEFAEKIKAEQERAKVAGESARILAPPPAVLPATQTTHGEVGSATSKKFWNYEATDLDALYRARPDLVKLEAKRREILEAIKTGKEIPGLRIFEDMSIAAR